MVLSREKNEQRALRLGDQSPKRGRIFRRKKTEPFSHTSAIQISEYIYAREIFLLEEKQTVRGPTGFGPFASEAEAVAGARAWRGTEPAFEAWSVLSTQKPPWDSDTRKGRFEGDAARREDEDDDTDEDCAACRGKHVKHTCEQHVRRRRCDRKRQRRAECARDAALARAVCDGAATTTRKEGEERADGDGGDVTDTRATLTDGCCEVLCETGTASSRVVTAEITAVREVTAVAWCAEVTAVAEVIASVKAADVVCCDVVTAEPSYEERVRVSITTGKALEARRLRLEAAAEAAAKRCERAAARWPAWPTGRLKDY